MDELEACSTPFCKNYSDKSFSVRKSSQKYYKSLFSLTKNDVRICADCRIFLHDKKPHKNQLKHVNTIINNCNAKLTEITSLKTVFNGFKGKLNFFYLKLAILMINMFSHISLR